MEHGRRAPGGAGRRHRPSSRRAARDHTTARRDMTSGTRCASATVAELDVAETTRLLLVIQLIDDVLDALELWQSVGVPGGRWVLSMWSRRVTPRIGIELPRRVRN